MEFQNEIVDSENYRSNEVFGFREIVLRQLQRVVQNMSQEMRPGTTVYTQASNQIPQVSRYLGDTRDEFTNSLDCLHDLLKPKFDEEMKTSSDEIYTKLDEMIEELQNQKPNPAKQEVNDFFRVKLRLYRKIFQEICEFLERLGWLQSGNIED